MKTLITFTTCICLFLNSFSQDLKYISFNILSSGIIGGVGAGINKHKEENLRHAIKNGFIKGCAGGAVNYASKYMLSWQKSYTEKLNWRVFWSSKIVNSVSNTMIYNAVNNNDKWLKNYSINIGFLKFSIDNKVQIDIISVACMGYIFSTGAKLKIKRSLTIGTPSFDYKWEHITFKTKNRISSHPKIFGYALGQNIVTHKNISCSIIKHELIHTYQRLQYSSIVPIKKYENIGVFHLDISIFDLLHFIQNKTIGYGRNIFECESNYFEELK